MKNIPDEKKIEEMLENVSLDTSKRLDQRLSNAPWTQRAARRQRFMTIVAFTILIFALLITLPAKGRAFAQSILQFFVRAGSDTLPVPTETVDWVELTAGVPQPHAASTPRPAITIFSSDCGEFPTPTCSVEQIREKVDFTVKELSDIPEGMYFIGATGGPDSIFLKYEFENNSGGLTIFEERWTGKPAEGTSEVGASALVEKVQIGNLAGEYFRGSFSMKAGDPVTVWDPNFPAETLRWVDGNISYTLGYDFTTQMPLGKERLIALAQGMTTGPVAKLPLPATARPESNEFSLRNVFNLSLPQAEELVGFKLYLPSQLPEFLSFLGAKYEGETKVVRVFYVVEEPYMNGLTVSQQVVSDPDDCAICDIVVGDNTQLGSDRGPMIVGADSNLETVEIGNVTGKYVTGVWKGTDCCGWVWDSEPFLQTLRWQIEDRAFELQYAGSDLGKTDLIAIAEDLK